jgi:hypothetical protein
MQLKFIKLYNAHLHLISLILSFVVDLNEWIDLAQETKDISLEKDIYYFVDLFQKRPSL